VLVVVVVVLVEVVVEVVVVVVVVGCAGSGFGGGCGGCCGGRVDMQGIVLQRLSLILMQFFTCRKHLQGHNNIRLFVLVTSARTPPSC
jgi:preprotein translocase subunit SecG